MMDHRQEQKMGSERLIQGPFRGKTAGEGWTERGGGWIVSLDMLAACGNEERSSGVGFEENDGKNPTVFGSRKMYGKPYCQNSMV